MKKFDEQLLRLKAELKETEDQAIAAYLGLTKAAFSDRKRRDAFPADKLRALAQLRPDLNIDVDYVLTGVSLDLGKTMAAYAGSAAGKQLLAEVTLGHMPGKVSPSPSAAPGEVVALPVSDSGGLTWRRILVIAIDELNAAGKRLPGEKLLELVDLLMAWQAEGVKVDAEKMRAQIRLVA